MTGAKGRKKDLKVGDRVVDDQSDAGTIVAVIKTEAVHYVVDYDDDTIALKDRIEVEPE